MARGGKNQTKRDGYWRPQNCLKYCIYNRADGCKYKFGQTLTKPISSWQKCQYFKPVEDEKKKPKGPYDVMYGRMAIYKDSHSAMWME